MMSSPAVLLTLIYSIFCSLSRYVAIVKASKLKILPILQGSFSNLDILISLLSFLESSLIITAKIINGLIADDFVLTLIYFDFPVVAKRERSLKGHPILLSGEEEVLGV